MVGERWIGGGKKMKKIILILPPNHYTKRGEYTNAYIGVVDVDRWRCY